MSENATQAWIPGKTCAGQGMIYCEASGRNVALTYDLKDAPLVAEAPAMLAALEAARFPNWPHNAAITGDIEALRAVCLSYSQWWNDIALPAITAAKQEA